MNISKIPYLIYATVIAFGLAMSEMAVAMSDYEREIKTIWLSSPANRAEAEKAYWAEMKRQVDEMNTRVPVPISRVQIIKELNLVGKTITYSYWVHPSIPADKTGEVAKRVRQRVCSGEGSQFFFDMMGGRKVFAYFRMGSEVPFEIISIVPSDCNKGASI